MSIVVSGEAHEVPEVVNPYAEIIVPPPAIRDVIDKTAQFVANHGVEFEKRMMLEANAEERFGFLFAGHSYRDYYDIKLREVQQGKVQAVVPMVPEAVKQVWEREKNEQLALKNDAQVDEKAHEQLVIDDEDVKGIMGFEQYQFAITRPPMTTQDDDVMKLTARFVALNGQAFLSGLAQRERGNPVFEFLRTGHPHHLYFRSLIDSYSRVINIVRGEDTTVHQRLQHLNGSDYKDHPVPKTESQMRLIAGKIWSKQKRQAMVEEERRKEEEAAAMEKAAIESLDWERFVVVETIAFTDADHDLTLPAPDWNPRASVTIIEPLIVPTPARDEVKTVPPPVKTSSAVPAVTAQVDGEEQKIVLKPEYVRRLKRSVPGKYLKCPITGELILAEEMTNHLKVLLLDKQWKKQRDELLARALADSAYAPDSDIETNIANFVLKRPDLFGTVEDEIQEHSVRGDSTTPVKRSRM